MSNLTYSIRSGMPAFLLALALALAHVRGASGVTVSVGNAAGPPGSTVTIAISLDNDVPVRAVQLRLTDTPNQLTLVPGSARTTTRSTALMADANEQDNGSVIAILISTGVALIAAGSGPILELDFAIAPSASLGSTITLGLSEALVADENRTPLPVDVQNGSVSVALPTATPTSTATQSPTATPTQTPVPCVGDCNASHTVTVDELVKGVNIALGLAPLADCRSFDSSGDGKVTVDELVKGVNNALCGCGLECAAPAATATRTAATPTQTPEPTGSRAPTATATPTATRTAVIPTRTPTPTRSPSPTASLTPGGGSACFPEYAADVSGCARYFGTDYSNCLNYLNCLSAAADALLQCVITNPPGPSSADQAACVLACVTPFGPCTGGCFADEHNLCPCVRSCFESFSGCLAICFPSQ